MRNIFEIVGSRCGVSPDKLNFDEAKVKVTDFDDEHKKESEAFYQTAANRVYIDVLPIFNQTWEMSGRPEVADHKWNIDTDLMFVLTLRALIHEKIHAISFIRIEEMGPDSRIVEAIDWVAEKLFKRPPTIATRTKLSRVRGGYFERENPGKAKHEIFDEGVTEKLTMEILGEYLARYCGDEFNPQKIAELIGKISQSHHYDTYVQLVDEVIEKLAADLEMDKSDVWHAIVRSKLEGVDFDDPDVKPVFEAVEAREKLFDDNK